MMNKTHAALPAASLALMRRFKILMFVVSLLGIGACERDSRTPDPQPAPPKPKTLHGEATPVLEHVVFVYHRDKVISGKADEKNQRH